MTTLTEWANFYVIVGSSAGALIGLQFVVITLIASTPVTQIDARATGAFSTPSVVHFEAVLFLSALASAPWTGLASIAIVWGLLGLFGIIYSLVVTWRLRTQTAYQPVFEDWLFHAILPVTAYVALAGSAGAIQSHTRPALFLVAAAALLLLFIGIHNAWDAVTYHTFTRSRENLETGPSGKPKGS
jgi:hypothetical protein